MLSGQALLELLATNGPWAVVIVVSVVPVMIVIMFVCAMVLVPKEKRVEAIKAMADLVRALRSGKRQL